MAENQKKVVFISHITEEQELAEILRDFLGEVFLNMIKIFVSSDSLEAGDLWRRVILEKLQQSSLLIVLCSQASIKRAWVNFEAGTGFGRNIPVIPICHTDLKPGDLPSPLDSFQGVNANKKSGLERVTKRIADDVLGSKKPTPRDLDSIILQIKQFEKQNAERYTNDVTDALIKDIETACLENRWGEVIRIGSVLSRPLWVTGKYRLRLYLGKLVAEAAKQIDQPDVQAQALIDDLGWTSYALDKVDEAKEKISYGLEIAEENDLVYVAYKGYRHLSGIAMDCGEFKCAAKYLEKSKSFIQQIRDSREKEEAEAGSFAAMGFLQLKKCEWPDALQNLKKAQELYIKLGDEDRKVKLYPYIGDACPGVGKLDKAREAYHQGLKEAQQRARKDVILHCYEGLGKVAEIEGHFNICWRSYESAAQIAEEFGLRKRAKEMREKVEEIRGKTLHYE